MQQPSESCLHLGRAVRSRVLAQPPPRPYWLTCPNLARSGRARLPCTAGLAPINKDSGKYHGPRHIAEGRTTIRPTLYMAALTAIKHNPVMRLFAKRLQKNGKPSKLVITAVMRKLIVTLNAILRSGEPWRHAEIA